MNNHFDEKDLSSILQRGEAVEYKYAYISDEAVDELTTSLGLILKEFNMEILTDELTYIFNELITNANKANLKRAYFRSNNMDISDDSVYQEGMKNFINVIQKDYSRYFQMLSKYNLYTRIRFQILDKSLIIRIINSHCPTRQEIVRIGNILIKSKQIRNALEAFNQVGDKTEGASLGTITSLLMLRRLGLPDSAYSFQPNEDNKETFVSLQIPFDVVLNKQAIMVSEEIAHEINTLPVFPENIHRLLQMINNESIDFGKIAEVIQSDLALTADILKIVNSAQYMLPSKVSNISNALSLIGMNALKNLLYSCGAQQIFNDKYGRQEELWEHAFRCASYSYKLAKDQKLIPLCDEAYLGGILHDMGKIIIKSIHPLLLEVIKAHCNDKGIEGDLLEKIAMGISHETIGTEIAKKWNFPEILTTVIQYHHDPLHAPEQDKEIVYTVYLANILTSFREASFKYSSIKKDVLKFFKIKNEEELFNLELSLDQYYEKQKLKVQSDK